MLPSSSLTRSQFEQACKAFISKYHGQVSTDLLSKRLTGWTWVEHSTFPGLGFMSRTRFVSRDEQHSALGESADDGEDYSSLSMEHDDAALPHSTHEALVITQSVVFSATFRVPAFYFTIHDAKGSPLPLDEILQTPMIIRGALPETNTSFSVSVADSPFPLLSQGDHPTLGTPSWFIHPCETPSAMAELSAELKGSAMAEDAVWSEDEWLIRWMEIWFMVLGNVVRLDS
ncbi:hypothetical protein DENSPDRAFT_16928 [Dentipellis sp. KUC8613]|nr:hypothetical protein DENSPDRAFT_16928 [Dentipellis sp. KUC8613]